MLKGQEHFSFWRDTFCSFHALSHPVSPGRAMGKEYSADSHLLVKPVLRIKSMNAHATLDVKQFH